MATKDVACATRSESPPLPASLAVGSTLRVKRTCLLALLDVRNACLRFCCTVDFNCVRTPVALRAIVA